MAKQWHQLERLDHKALKKLQAEREKAAKLAAQKEKQQKMIIIGVLVLIFMAFIVAIGVLITNKKNSDELNAAKEKLLYSSVFEYNGKVEYRKTADWVELSSNITFKEDCYFKTHDDSTVTVQLQADNQVKLYKSSEILIKPPIVEEKEARVSKQIVELINGEMTSAISIDGKGLLSIQVSNLTVIGQSGLFKVIYNEEKNSGEIVVKNGLVEVSINDSSDKPTKLSGFYKATFGEGELGKPVQASVIQYDWK